MFHKLPLYVSPVPDNHALVIDALSMNWNCHHAYAFPLTILSPSVLTKQGKRKVQGVPQSQTAALPRPLEEEKSDKSKQAQIEQTYEKH